MKTDLKSVAFTAVISVSSLVVPGGCSSSSPSTPGNGGLDDDTPAREYFTLELMTDDTADFSQALLLYRLYGYNSRLADADAVVLQEDVTSISAIPVQVDLHWPVGAAQMIQPPLGQASDARYYYSLSVDIDADRAICEGDLVQDYDLTPFTVLEEKPGVKQVYFMKQKVAASGDCVFFN